MLGRNQPPLEALIGAAGFADIRFSQWQKDSGNRMWTLPRADGYLQDNLPVALEESSLFHTVARSGNPQLESETRKLIAMSDGFSGKPWRNINAKRFS
jgi:hypothetical protein